MVGGNGRVNVEPGFAEGKGSVVCIIYVGGVITAQANPVVEILPAGRLDVQLAVAGRKRTAISTATAAAGRTVNLCVAAETGEIRHGNGGVVESNPTATVSTFVDRPGHGAGKVRAARINRKELRGSGGMGIWNQR